MNRYLLDTNHLSAYLDRQSKVMARVNGALRSGDRVGICLPVHCEYRAGIRSGKRYQRNLMRLQGSLAILRIWPSDEETAIEFGKLVQELRSAGKMLSQFDLLIAAIARQQKLTLLSADADFEPVAHLKVENWL